MPVLDGELAITSHLREPPPTLSLGYGATTQIRKIEASRSGQKSHILALTGMSSLEDKRRAFEAGVDG
jgi:CheY-like chemotaxis protein